MTSVPLPDRVVQAVHNLEPEITLAQIQRKWSLYIRQVEEALLSSTDNRGGLGELNLTRIAWQKVRINPFKHNNKRIPSNQSLRDLFFYAHPLFTIIDIGSNVTNERTKIRANKNTRMLLQQIDAESVKLDETKMKDMIAAQTTTTVICLDTLREYIAQTDVLFEQATNAPDRARVERNLLFAKSVEALALKAYAIDAESYPKFVKTSDLYGKLTYATIPAIESDSRGGRIYLKGINLQNAPKEVRRAALGPCYEIDITQCAFNIKLAAIHKFIVEHPINWCKEINNEVWQLYKELKLDRVRVLSAEERESKTSLDNLIAKTCTVASAFGELTQQFPCTAEMVRDRETVLKNLRPAIKATSHDFVKDRWLKTFITAISFGATKGNAYKSKNGYEFPALRTIIKNTEDYDRVCAADNNWVDRFIAEQKQINNIILQIVISQENAVVPLVDEHDKKLSASQVSALYFQYYETQIMNAVAAFAQQHNSQVILRVHDGLYLTKQLPYGSAEINEALQAVTGYKLSLGNGKFFDWPALPFYKSLDYTWFKCTDTAHNVTKLIADNDAALRAEFENKKRTRDADAAMHATRSIEWAKSHIKLDNNTTQAKQEQFASTTTDDEVPDLIERPEKTTPTPDIVQQRRNELTEEEKCRLIIEQMRKKK